MGLIDPYRGRKTSDPTFVAVAEKVHGTAIGTIYKKTSSRDPDKRYLGKVCFGVITFPMDFPKAFLNDNRKMNYGAMQEKIAYDLYQEMGRGIYHVPKSYLSKQNFLDPFTSTNVLASCFVSSLKREEGSAEIQTLRIMCRIIKNYHNFGEAKTLLKSIETEEEMIVDFSQYIEKMHRPPEELLTPEGKLVPIRGLMGLLAVARILADTDVLGGKGDNAGFIWVREASGEITAAQTVKIDPGMAFQFENKANWAYSYIYEEDPQSFLTNARDIQIANQNHLLTLYWDSLTHAQKGEFLQVLYNSSRYLYPPKILHYFFYRNGRFNRSETEVNPEEFARDQHEKMQAWFELQINGIYFNDMMDFNVRGRDSSHLAPPPHRSLSEELPHMPSTLDR